MASIVQSFPDQHQDASWLEQYLDGQIWRLAKGTDFQCKAVTARAYFMRLCRTRGLVGTTSLRKAEPDVLYVQATKEK
jgi:hypothetical protein